MNRPERRNAFSIGLMRDVMAAYKRFHADPEVVAAVVTGAGVGFSSGMDRKEQAEITLMEDPEARARASREWQELQHAFGAVVMRRDGAKPVVTAINGDAVGGGISVALSGI